MRGSDFIIDSVQLLYYKCHKKYFKRRGSYVDSPDWIKKKKAKISPKNTDDKFALSVALSYEEIEPHLEKSFKY